MSLSRLSMLVCAIAAVLFAGLPDAKAQNSYGAIAFSPSDGAFGSWKDAGSREIAENGAQNLCQNYGGTDCRPVTWFRNSCGVLAVGNGNAWGAAQSSDVEEAQSTAVEMCSRYGAGCRVRHSVCSPSGG